MRKTAKIEFYFKEEGNCSPVGYQYITLHMVFNVKMDFTRITCFVEGVHHMEPLESAIYAYMVLRDSDHAVLLISVINDVDVLIKDIQGSYINIT